MKVSFSPVSLDPYTFLNYLGHLSSSFGKNTMLKRLSRMANKHNGS
jgi:hypothetical protein